MSSLSDIVDGGSLKLLLESARVTPVAVLLSLASAASEAVFVSSLVSILGPFLGPVLMVTMSGRETLFTIAIISDDNEGFNIIIINTIKHTTSDTRNVTNIAR